jgi:hypothetical protein
LRGLSALDLLATASVGARLHRERQRRAQCKTAAHVPFERERSLLTIKQSERERERGERERSFIENQTVTEGRQVQRSVEQHRLSL